MDKQEKPYVDASEAARLLGVDRTTVVDDVETGFTNLHHLIGEVLPGGICVVDRSELRGERLEFHRRRLAERGSEVQP